MEPPRPVPETPKVVVVSSTAEQTPVQAASGVRYFEFIGGSSRKFWEISQSDHAFTVRFGRIGTPGQSQTRTFPDQDQAKREAERLIAEKLKKGYEEKGPKPFN